MKPLFFLNKFRQQKDKRPAILFAAVLVMLVVVPLYIAFMNRETSVYMKYGDIKNWPVQNNKLDNYTFSYPEQMDIIIPEDEFQNPTSLVKKGERGENVLIQLGTWRADPKPESLEAAISRYEMATRAVRSTVSRDELIIDGRQAVTLRQNEEGGRFLIETLIWDNGQPREISLQLSKNTNNTERIFYENVYRAILRSIIFNYDVPDINH